MKSNFAGAGEDVQSDGETLQWLLANPDECASAVADAYSQFSPASDDEYGDFATLLRKEIAYQRLKSGLGGFHAREAARGSGDPEHDDDSDRDDSPYCDCGSIPGEEEEAFNRCSACGKRLDP